jgi:glycerophosphoryl diester phosphodiesterase
VLAAAALAGCASTAALLVEPWTGLARAVALARDAGCGELHLPVQVLRRDSAAVERVREAGLQVVVWTVNRPDEVRQARALGAGVITDHPGAVARDVGVRSAGASGRATVRPRRAALAAPR